MSPKSSSPLLFVEQRRCCCTWILLCHKHAFRGQFQPCSLLKLPGGQTFYLSSIRRAADNSSHPGEPGGEGGVLCCQRALETPAAETSSHSPRAALSPLSSPADPGSGSAAAVNSTSQCRVRCGAVKDSHSEDSGFAVMGFRCFQRAFRSA